MAPRDPLAFSFFTEIGIIEQLARNRFERVLPAGLKMSQFTVLNHLARLGGAWAPTRLARAFQVTKGAMTNTLARLEARGLVEIRPDPRDGRAKLVTLTPAGGEMRERCIRALAPQLADFQAAIPEAELAPSIPLLRRARVYLDQARDLDPADQ